MSRYSQFRNPLFEYGQLELEDELENNLEDEFDNEGENQFIDEIIQSFTTQNVNFTEEDLETMEDILNNPDLYTIDDFNYVTQNSENLNIYRDEMGLFHVEFRLVNRPELEDFEEIEDMEDMEEYDENIEYEYDPGYLSEEEEY